MYQVRHGVFETNSSSSHSLVIMRDGFMLSPQEFLDETWVNRGKLSIYDNEYGRSPFRVLRSPQDKLAYVLAAFHGTDHFQSIIDQLKEYVPKVKEIVFPTEYERGRNGPSFNYGYIDHQSVNIVPYAVNKGNIDPLDIVLNTKYVIIVDGDEYDEFGKLVSSGMISMDKIEKIYDLKTLYCERRNMNASDS